MNKIMTLEDLHRFYSSKGKKAHFNAKNDNDRIIVSVSGNMVFEKSSDNTEGLTPVTLQACHTEDNVNGSYISESSMTTALPSFSNRPILAYIYKDENGDYQFRDHAMHIDNETDEIVYDESPVGIIPESCNAKLEYDEDKGKTYVVVNGYIFDEYSQALNILEREGECAVSVELSIRELSYDANNDWLSIDDFFFSGVTLLGKWESGENVLPGMSGSNIKLADFQQRNQISYSQDDVIAMLDKINRKIDQLTIERNRKEDTLMEFEENAKVTDSEETVTEEFEEVTSEATEESTEDNTTVTEAMAEDTEDVTPTEGTTFEAEAENADETEKVEEESEDAKEDTDTESEGQYNLKMSITLGEKSYERFASLNSVIQGLTELVNDTFAEEDGAWYSVEAFDDGTAKSRYLIMTDWFTGKGYKVSYTNKDGILALKGEREEVTFEWLTASEKAELDSMRANYSSIESELAKYKAEPEKMAVLESEDYKNLEGTEAFESLKAQDAHFDLSVDEVKAKCDEMLLEYAKGHKVEFGAKEEEAPKKTVGFKRVIPENPNKKSGKYGGIFSRNK